jgi:hypothetical protein
MTAPGFALFETALGRCAIAWGERGIVSLQGLRRMRMPRGRGSCRYPGAKVRRRPTRRGRRRVRLLLNGATISRHHST